MIVKVEVGNVSICYIMIAKKTGEKNLSDNDLVIDKVSFNNISFVNIVLAVS